MLKLSLVLTLIYITTSSAYDGPAIVSQNQNILRSYGNLGQVSTYSKTLDTPFTSVRKADVRITNPGVITSPAYAHHIGYPSGPSISYPGASPIGYPGSSIGYPGLVAHHHALPTLAHTGYVRPSSPIATTYSTPSYIGATIPGKTVVQPGGAGLLGVAYSAAPAVSHMSFSNGLGLTYEW